MVPPTHNVRDNAGMQHMANAGKHGEHLDLKVAVARAVAHVTGSDDVDTFTSAGRMHGTRQNTETRKGQYLVVICITAPNASRVYCGDD